jgi:WhiB family redox-sensing transcriptional regulator
MSTRDFMVDALCAQTDPDIFFPNPGENARAAKKICAACPVINECLKYALENGEDEGVYGGMSTWDRRLLMKERAA